MSGAATQGINLTSDTTALRADAPIQAVLFDLDDTLWPIVPVIRHAEQTLHDWLLQHVPAVAEQWSIESLR